MAKKSNPTIELRKESANARLGVALDEALLRRSSAPIRPLVLFSFPPHDAYRE